MLIYVATDHTGVKVKEEVIKYLESNGIEAKDIGLPNHDTDDYTDFAFELGRLVIQDKALGILICGNGIGMSIAANKVKGIRAARVCSVDDACKAKNHNGANVITFGANLDMDLIKEIIDSFIGTKGPDEERHMRRVAKIEKYESGN
jgi:ribose 5-phosphate isomerase B